MAAARNSKSSVIEHPDFSLLIDTKNNMTTLPILNQEIWDFYKNHEAVFWTVEEVQLAKDVIDWEEKLTENERKFIKNILAFFAASDAIVADNLQFNFSEEIDIKEAKYFFRFQAMIEDIHSEMYSRMIEAFIKDKDERHELFNAVNHYPCIAQKSEWGKKWTDPSKNSLAIRLMAFAIIEGIHFSGAFCAIFWLKKRNLMPGLTFSNEFISRDEGLHSQFGTYMFTKCKVKPSKEKVFEIFKEAVDIEKEFITDSIPCALLGMNNILMKQYIEYVSDRLLIQLGYDKMFNVDNPFPFMENISINNKTNFFENRVSEYNMSGIGSKEEDMKFELDDDF